MLARRTLPLARALFSHSGREAAAFRFRREALNDTRKGLP